MITAGIALEGDNTRCVVGEIDPDDCLTFDAVINGAICDEFFFEVKSHGRIMPQFFTFYE